MIDSTDACMYPKICAQVAAVTNEINGMRDDFEKSVAHLLTACPIEAKTGTKRNNAHISGLGGYLKKGTGPQTGVDLRYSKPPKFAKLSDAEKEELIECRPARKNASKKGKGKKVQVKVGKKAWNKKIKGPVAALVKSQTATLKKQQEAETADLNDIATVISSFSNDQGYQKPSEANENSPETDEVSVDLYLNEIMKKWRSDP